jgi:hypothetical protein
LSVRPKVPEYFSSRSSRRICPRVILT